jgi:hypothetical protein
MVYCGKPSKGCENCRKRRLKCGQQLPRCGQCRNTGRICLGYRDPNALVIRDESERIAKKAQKSEAKKALALQKSRNGNQDVASEQAGSSMISPYDFQSIVNGHQALEESGVSFLLRDFVEGSHFAYLPDFFSDSRDHRVLLPVIKAVGVASLGQQSGRLELHEQAQLLYSKAISATNKALQDVDTARTDEVLGSILLLSLYETLACRKTEVSVQAWQTHIQGALALLTLRGHEQFSTKFGMQLFKQIATCIRIHCLHNALHVPRLLHNLTKVARKYASPDDITFEHLDSVVPFIDLRADIAQGILTKPEDILAAAENTLIAAESFYNILPSHFNFETVAHTKRCPEVYGTHYFRFVDHHAAQFWNLTWMTILDLNRIKLRQLEKLFASALDHQGWDAELATKVAVARQAIVDGTLNVCASVPQFFPPADSEDIKHGSEKTLNSPSAPVTGRPRRPAVGYFLIWPLFLAGASAEAPFGVREYIANRLRHIGEVMKLPQALQAAELLDRNLSSENFLSVYHVF